MPARIAAGGALTLVTPARAQARALDWQPEAKHPHHQRPYPQPGYQPRVEVMPHLWAHGVKTASVTGGGRERLEWTPGAPSGAARPVAFNLLDFHPQRHREFDTPYLNQEEAAVWSWQPA